MARPKRYLRNYLLDKRFQLKYAGLLIAVAALLSSILGFLLWRTSQSLVEQSKDAVAQGQKVVVLGQKLVEESQKVTKVVEMNLIKEYGDFPELLAELKKENAAKTETTLAEQQAGLQAQANALTEQSLELERQQQLLLWSLFGILSLLVVGVGFAGIIVTHRVAGPIFKMKRQMNDLVEDHWWVPKPLRPGDELVEFFEAFRRMVMRLREQRERELAVFDEMVDRVDFDEDELESLAKMREELSRVLDGEAPRQRA